MCEFKIEKLLFRFKYYYFAEISVCGETAALRAVLAAGAPVSTPDIHGGYPLHYAAQMCGGVSKRKWEYLFQKNV